jgi:hypothetical protein
MAQTATRKNEMLLRRERNMIVKKRKRPNVNRLEVFTHFQMQFEARNWKMGQTNIVKLHFRSIIDFPNWVIESCFCLDRAPDQINSKASWVAFNINKQIVRNGSKTFFCNRKSTFLADSTVVVQITVQMCIKAAHFSHICENSGVGDAQRLKLYAQTDPAHQLHSFHVQPSIWLLTYEIIKFPSPN